MSQLGQTRSLGGGAPWEPSGQGPKTALDQSPHDQAGKDIRHPVRQDDDSRCNNQAARTQATGAHFGDAQETAEATAPTCMAWPEGKAS